MGLGQSQGLTVDSVKAKLAATALFSIIDREPKVTFIAPPAGAAHPPARAAGAVSFRGVKLVYPGRKDAAPALDGITLDIAPGSLVALVGSSGSGKSSLFALLERFYEPSAGAVLLDGVDVRTLPLAYTRSQIALVLQEPSLFSESVAFNVGFPDVETGDAAALKASPDCQKAAAAAGAADFVEAMPDKFSTKCGTRGSQLSGGQKQRLCIARALARNAPIILLDEATSVSASAKRGG